MRNYQLLHDIQPDMNKEAGIARFAAKGGKPKSAAFYEAGEMDKSAFVQGLWNNHIKPGFNNAWNATRNGLRGAHRLGSRVSAGAQQYGRAVAQGALPALQRADQAVQRGVDGAWNRSRDGLQAADRGLLQGVNAVGNAYNQGVRGIENAGGATHDAIANAGSKLNQYKQNIQAVGHEAGDAYQRMQQGFDTNAQRHNQFASGGVNSRSFVAPSQNYNPQAAGLQAANTGVGQAVSDARASASQAGLLNPQQPQYGGSLTMPSGGMGGFSSGMPQQAPPIPRAVPVNEQTLQPIPAYPYGKSAFVTIGELDKGASKMQAGKKILTEGVDAAKGWLGKSVEKGKGLVDDAGKKVSELAEANPRAAKVVNIGGGAAIGGGVLYGANRRGHSSGMEQGKEVGWDAGLQHGIAGAQQGAPNGFLERLMALFGGGQIDPQSIFEAANSNRDKVLSQLTYKG